MTLGFDDGAFTDWLVNLPLSYELIGSPIVIHANVGWIRWRDDGNRDRASLGAGFSWEFSPGLDLLGQVYREGADEDAEAHFGLRLHPGNRIDYIDLAGARSLGGSGSWQFTVGLALTF